jgi:hypothetical protein
VTSNSGGASLREQLGGAADPDFEVKLPPGWERRTPDESDRLQIESALKKKTMEAHRPDVYAKLSGMLKEAYELMRQQRAIAFYTPVDTTPGATVPGSMTASIARPPSGQSLDDLVRHAISEYGATPLFGDKRFVRFERDKTVEIDGGSVIQTTIIYLTPVPGSGRRRALQLTATFARPIDASADDEKVKMFAATFDVIASTLRWIPPAARAQVSAV